MRESSLTLPSSTGTLKSTRTSTRLRAGSKSRTVSLSIACVLLSICGLVSAPDGRGLQPVAGAEALPDERDEVCHAAGVAPLVVVPGDDLDHIAQNHRVDGADDGRVLVALEVHRDERLIGVVHDAIEVAVGGLLERLVDFFLGYFAAKDGGEVDDRNGRRGYAERHAREFALQLRDHERHCARGAGLG